MLLPIIAFTLSIDALAVGLSFGIKKIRLPAATCLIVFLVSAGVSFLSVCMGQLILQILPGRAADIISIVLLVVMGLVVMRPALPKRKAKPKAEKSVLEFALRPFHITIRILIEPGSGDRNESGSIDRAEAIPVALALSLDTIGAGIALGASGFGYVFPLLVGALQTLFLKCGQLGGERLARWVKINEKAASIVAGGVLILLAVLRLF